MKHDIAIENLEKELKRIEIQKKEAQREMQEKRLVIDQLANDIADFDKKDQAIKHAIGVLKGLE